MVCGIAPPRGAIPQTKKSTNDLEPPYNEAIAFKQTQQIFGKGRIAIISKNLLVWV